MSQNYKRVFFYFLILVVLSSVTIAVEYSYSDDAVFSIQKDNEAVIHLLMQKSGKVYDEYALQAGAPDCKVRFFDIFDYKNSSYLILEFDYGSLGTRTQIEQVDLLFFLLNDSKFKLLHTVTIKDIVYDANTKKYYSNTEYSYYYNRLENTVDFFNEINGEIILIDKISLEVFTVTGSFSEARDKLQAFADAVNRSDIPYKPISQNSNSFAFQATELLTGKRPTELYWSPGAKTKLETK